MTSYIEFDLSEQHLKLFRHAYVSWNNTEYGAPGISGKRPYGNSDVPGDMRAILDLPEATDEELRMLHTEMETALQIVLCTGSFTAGKYVAEEYDKRSWQRGDLA